jgi:ABC-type uncharacterized transport system substrate-binding protein
MQRRDFITLLGGMTAAWPLAARAQQPERMRRIGVLINRAPEDPETQTGIAEFLQGLQALGWSVGRNVRIDYRYSAGDVARYGTHAAELVALAPDVVLAAGSVVVRPLQQAIRTVPVVFVRVIDPVASGLVASLAQPGGNATGFANFEYSIAGKYLELLKEIAPQMTRVGVLRDPTAPGGTGQFGAI